METSQIAQMRSITNIILFIVSSTKERYRIGDYAKYSELNLSIVHVRIHYDPLSEGGTFSIVVDNHAAHNVTNVSMDSLIPLFPNKTAYSGFTASTHG